jgi:ABC-2 type transport system permease protein
MPPRKIAIAYYTMMYKEFVRVLRIWSQTLLPPVITTSLYFIIFGAFIGSQLTPIHGVSYIQFIVPGLIMMTIITSSYTASVTSVFMAKFMKTIEELLTSPTPDWVIILGFVSIGVMRGLIVGTLVLLASLFFTHLAITNVLVILFAFILTSALFSLGGLLNGLFAKSFDTVSIIPTFVLTPLTYLGGIFYSIEMLPEFWQTVSLANPIIYMVNAFRYGFLGISDIPLWICFTVILSFVAVFVCIALFLFRKGIGMKN